MKLLFISLLLCSPCYSQQLAMSAKTVSPTSGRDSPEWYEHHYKMKERKYIAYRTRYQTIYGHRNHRYDFKVMQAPIYGPAPFILNPRYYRQSIYYRRPTYILPVPRL